MNSGNRYSLTLNIPQRKIVAIDPGTENSAVVTIDSDGEVRGKILGNEDLELWLIDWAKKSGWDCAIEMIACYGQRVGREVFETCVWIGRFLSAWEDESTSGAFDTPRRIVRSEVKMELCNTNRANDADIRAALIDLYGPGKEKAVGLKASPGPLYGFRKDMWAALAVAVTYARMLEREEQPDRIQMSVHDKLGIR